MLSAEEIGVSQRAYSETISSLSQFHQIEKVIIFGSRAIGNFKPGSDIDLAIDGPLVTTEIAMNLSVALNERSPLPYKFDVVCLQDVSGSALGDHIITYGKVLYLK